MQPGESFEIYRIAYPHTNQNMFFHIKRYSIKYKTTFNRIPSSAEDRIFQEDCANNTMDFIALSGHIFTKKTPYYGHRNPHYRAKAVGGPSQHY